MVTFGRKAYKQTFLIIGSLIFTFIFLEVLLRWWGGSITRFDTLPVTWILTEQEWDIDPDTIFIKKSVAEKIANFKPQHSQRPLIVALGDSFTAGNPVAEKNNFVSRFSHALLHKGYDHDILNVGVSGFGPDQELTLMKRILHKGIRPKIVIWTFYVNDLFENGQQPTFTIDKEKKLTAIPGSEDFIYQRQKFFNAIPLPVEVKGQSAVVAVLLHAFKFNLNQQIQPQYRPPTQNYQWAMEKLKLEVQQMHELSAQYDFVIVPVLIESQRSYFFPEQLKTMPPAESYEDTFNLMNTFLENEPNYLMLNLNELVQSPEYNHLFHRCAQGGIDYFIADDDLRDSLPFGVRHFNEKGYDIFGQIMAEHLDDLGLLSH